MFAHGEVGPMAKRKKGIPDGPNKIPCTLHSTTTVLLLHLQPAQTELQKIKKFLNATVGLRRMSGLYEYVKWQLLIISVVQLYFITNISYIKLVVDIQ